MAPTLKKTQDGYSWTGATGVRKGGLRCRGVIEPSEKVTTPAGYIHDAIVIGAGYAGLMAAREMTDRGLSVLLLEARDRVGGRTYTVDADGILYEMGGTWVTHHMAFLFKEMIRYGMDRDLITTHHSGFDNDYYTLDIPGVTPRKLSHEEAGKIAARGWDIFVNVDGENCRRICPLPHAQLENILTDRNEVERYDKISCRERFEAIKHLLTAEEAGVLVALLLHISGGTMENSSLWDMIRSHALMSYSSDNFGPIWTTFKLREGQSELATRMFQDAVKHGLQYDFKTPITSIKDHSNGQTQLVEVRTNSGAIHRARRVVSTVPLNALRTIHFEPPLSPKRQEALEIGHVNFMTKIHAEVEGPGLASWNGVKYPNLLMFGYGDGVTENGNARIVGFGKDERATYVPEHHPERTIDAFEKLHPMTVKKMVFHNWVTDPWSRGGPAWWTPEYMTKYQDELQSRHGNVHFASADWANGWRAAIDGALEQGFIAAQEIAKELRETQARFTAKI
ncbi:amine oxidase [Penicillium cataractarum]|uniref:Amine oxidase n=1 Tax=Penicillium cataractarum TaxID=2100454 RepID=A0A9W9VHY8_9EURO|nr:amine oxidase [Penicillium cataractarum]KAJ5380095.1 amine oxidase [Penicillium cataractarum]